jgi:hypothetical protein
MRRLWELKLAGITSKWATVRVHVTDYVDALSEAMKSYEKLLFALARWAIGPKV